MSVERDGPETGERPDSVEKRNSAEKRDPADEYYLVSPSPTTKKRHRPDETGDEPACRAFLQRDDAGWRKLTSRQTVFYDDCANCFPRE